MTGMTAMVHNAQQVHTNLLHKLRTSHVSLYTDHGELKQSHYHLRDVQLPQNMQVMVERVTEAQAKQHGINQAVEGMLAEVASHIPAMLGRLDELEVQATQQRLQGKLVCSGANGAGGCGML